MRFQAVGTCLPTPLVLTMCFLVLQIMSHKVETRSDKKKSKDKGESSIVPLVQVEPERHGPTPRSLVDGYGPQELLNSPPDCFPSSLKDEQLDAISRTFRIDRAQMRLPGNGVMPYNPQKDILLTAGIIACAVPSLRLTPG